MTSICMHSLTHKHTRTQPQPRHPQTHSLRHAYTHTRMPRHAHTHTLPHISKRHTHRGMLTLTNMNAYKTTHICTRIHAHIRHSQKYTRTRTQTHTHTITRAKHTHHAWSHSHTHNRTNAHPHQHTHTPTIKNKQTNKHTITVLSYLADALQVTIT